MAEPDPSSFDRVLRSLRSPGDRHLPQQRSNVKLPPLPTRPGRRTAITALILCALGAGWWFWNFDTVSSSEGMVDDALQSAPVEPLPELSTSLREQFARDWADEYDRLDPREDGWESEVFNEQAEAQLGALARLLANPGKLDAEHLAPLADEAFACDVLRPKSLEQVYEDAALTVHRLPQGAPPAVPGSGTYRQVAGLAAALGELAGAFAGLADVRAKFKVIGVDVGDTPLSTTAYFEINGRDGTRSVQQTATWRCQWSAWSDGDPPKLQWIGIEEFEEVVAATAGRSLFADCTEAVLGGSESFRQELMRGNGHWTALIPLHAQTSIFGHLGMAVGDANGDGLDDIYVCQHGGLPNRLFLQNRDGTATEVSAQAGVDWLDFSPCALFVDIDNDGDQDLVVPVGFGIVVLMENDGRGNFTVREVLQLSRQVQCLAAADYDGDGRLDLYIGSYVGGGPFGATPPLPLNDAENGGPNALYRNLGDWKFADVTEEVGLNQNNRRWTYAATWDDFDNDGLLDLYVANDFGRNNLYRNAGGRFVDVAAEAGVEDKAAGMSAHWGDFNRDGQMDLYVGNMFSSAGNRIAYQRRFKADASDSAKADLQRFARGNTLFENLGDGTFRDVSLEAGVTMGRWSWSCNFVDLNNNGWEDIVVANGHITQEDTGDL